MNHPDRLINTYVGCGVSIVAYVTMILTPNNLLIDQLLWAIVLLGLGWTLLFGHSVLFLALPVGLCFYFLRPPIKLQNGDARDADCSAIVRAYSILPDRIVLIKEFEFSEGNSIEGRSEFLPAMVRKKNRANPPTLLGDVNRNRSSLGCRRLR